MIFMRDEKGYAVPLVLMTMFVLTFLGTALWQYSIAETMQVSRDENKAQAYYIARSGADTVAEYIIKNPAQALALANTGQSSPKPLGRGTFSVDVSKGSNFPEEIIIESVGEVNGVSQTVILTVVNNQIFGDFAIFGNIIDIGGASAKIYGDIIFTNDDDTDFKKKILQGDSEGIHDPDKNYPPADFPTGLPIREDINLSATADTEDVDEEGEYDNISVSGGKLTFLLSGGNDLVIYAHDLKLTGNGEISLQGNGRLLLFVDEFTGGGTMKMEPDAGGDVSLVVFVKPGGSFDMAGTPNFKGAIYAPYANVTLQGTTTLIGSIISNNIYAGGSFTVIYEEINAGNLPIPAYTRGNWQWKN